MKNELQTTEVDDPEPQNTVEFQYETQQVDEVLGQSNFAQEFKQIFERFDYNELKRASVEDSSMAELAREPTDA